ncbi:MAG: hypothetical protein IE885_07380 [Campylobacterales bacterium]|nr:hypothetical protein [Campylobacterales bacterium]
MSKSIVFLCLCIGTLLAEEFPFVGIAVSSQKNTILNEERSQKTVSLHYGQQSLDWRTMFSYEFKGSEYKSFSVHIDKILLDQLFGTPKFRPYLGGEIGTLKMADPLLEDQNGYYYGLGGGLILYATDHVDIDVGYRYHWVQKIESLDTIKGVMLSLHYFF